MSDAFLLAGLRTPYGKLGGFLSSLDSLDLGCLALNALRERVGSLTEADGAMFGMVMQAGHGPNPARTALYRAGLDAVPGITLNNACLSGMDSVVDATRRIERGEGHMYLVGGFDSSSRASSVSSKDGELVSALHCDSLRCHISGESMTELSDRRNEYFGIGREAQDLFAVESHRRACAADFTESGEIFRIRANEGSLVDRDEGIRPETNFEKVSALAPVVEGGTITPANASQISDGAAVGVIGDLSTASYYGLKPIARIAGWGYSAGKTGSLHEQPGEATQDLLSRTGLSVDDIDIFEINEAFAGVALHAIAELGLSSDIVNVNGGAIAIGHPYGGTGFRLILSAALELRKRGLRRAVATMCGGGGQGIAVLIENV